MQASFPFALPTVSLPRGCDIRYADALDLRAGPSGRPARTFGATPTPFRRRILDQSVSETTAPDGRRTAGRWRESLPWIHYAAVPPRHTPGRTCHRGGMPEITCPACRVIDRADGIEDGNLFKVDHYHARNERAVFGALLRAQDRVADEITDFAGSLRFVYIHAVWFGLWILVNVGVVGASLEFDKFPFGLLTMVVSLEAIFLATFVMVTQNRQGKRADIRSQLDFETNLRSEIWSVHIGEALGIDVVHVEDVVRQAIEGSKSQLDVT